MNRTSILVFLSLGAPSIAACSANTYQDARLQQLAVSATSVRFSASTISSTPAPDVDVTVNDATKVSTLFEDTLALPPVPSGTQSECPFEGITYHLRFTSGSVTSTVRLLPDGACPWIFVDDTQPVIPDAAYWSELASTLGVPESSIYPYPNTMAH